MNATKKQKNPCTVHYIISFLAFTENHALISKDVPRKNTKPKNKTEPLQFLSFLSLTET